jgi:hypothetical protein
MDYFLIGTEGKYQKVLKTFPVFVPSVHQRRNNDEGLEVLMFIYFFNQFQRSG